MNVETPCSVRDVLYFANLLADADPLLIDAETDPVKLETRAADRLRYVDLIKEAEEDILDLRNALNA